MAKLFVGGLPPDVSAEHLKALFSSLTTVLGVSVNTKNAQQGNQYFCNLRNTEPTLTSHFIGSAFAHVELQNANDAAKCMLNYQLILSFDNFFYRYSYIP